MKNKINPRFSLLIILISLSAATRFLFINLEIVPMNFSALGAMALFGGAYFSKSWKALLFPLLILFLSDIIIQQFYYNGQEGSFLYEGWWVIYAVFAFIVLMGKRIIRKVTIKNVFIAAVAASLAHYFFTDLGVWVSGIDFTTGQPFTKDWNGFIKCYALALPYLKNFFAGTILYSALLFGLFEFAQSRFPIFRSKQAYLQGLS